MANGNDIVFDEREPDIAEGPSTEIMKVVKEGDPEAQLRNLEKRAALATRFSQAMMGILVGQTYPEDWKAFGEPGKEIVCLSSAGAERVAKNFNIQFFETKCHKEMIDDANGKGYRYIFEGKAVMDDRVIFAQGSFSTRDNLLGKKGGEWKPIEDINENHIRTAAYHIYTGNGIKGLLGLRGMPIERWNAIFNKAGQDTSGTKKVGFTQGKQGGTSADDTTNQQELYRIAKEMAQNNMIVTHDQSTNAYEADMASDSMEEKTMIEATINALSEFKGDKGWVGRKAVDQLKGKWLATTLKKAQEVYAKATAQ